MHENVNCDKITKGVAVIVVTPSTTTGQPSLVSKEATTNSSALTLKIFSHLSATPTSATTITTTTIKGHAFGDNNNKSNNKLLACWTMIFKNLHRRPCERSQSLRSQFSKFRTPGVQVFVFGQQLVRDFSGFTLPLQVQLAKLLAYLKRACERFSPRLIDNFIMSLQQIV